MTQIELDKNLVKHPENDRFNRQWLWGIGWLIAIFLALIPLQFSRAELVNSDGWPLLQRFLAASLHPELNLGFLRLTLKAAGVTLAFAVCGTVLSLGLGIVGGLLAAEIWWKTVFPHQFWGQSIGVGIRALLAIPRAIHELIWGLFFIHLFGLDPLVGLLAIVVPYSSIVAKVFSEILDETPQQPLMALMGSGISPPIAFLYSIVPQALPNLISYSFYRFECSLRSAAVLGMIGAGGLGYEIFLSLQSLRYEQLWTLFYALVILNGCVDGLSALVRYRLGAPTRLDLNLNRIPLKTGEGQLQHQSPPPIDQVLLILLVTSIVLIPLCFWLIDAEFPRLGSAQTLIRLQDIGQQVFPLRITGEKIHNLFRLSSLTLAMSVLAITVAGLGGICLSFLAAHNFLRPGGLLFPSNPRRNSDRKRYGRAMFWTGGIVSVTRLVLLICRAIPAPIWALVMLFIFFPGILPGAIALGIHNLGILGRLMAEGVENLEPKPLQALKAQGITAPFVFLYGVLPLCLPQFLAYILYRWEVCLRETVIVGLVGAGGLGRLLTEQLSSFDYSGVFLSLGCFVLLTFSVDLISKTMRRSLH